MSSTGLTNDEAGRRLVSNGPNEIVEERESRLRRIARSFWAPVPWMLEIVVAIQIAVHAYPAAALVATVLVFNIGLAQFQQEKANAALELLKQRLALRARVRRDGRWQDVPARTIVPGDVVQVSLGTVVPADLELVSGSVLLDQSMLTGESVPAEGGAGTLAYSGALVRRGEAIGVVTATGKSTYFGRTAELVRTAHVETAEVKAVLGLVRNLTVLNAAVLIFLVSYALVLRLPVSQIMLLVLTAMLSAVPVALPATFTLAATLGARSLANRGVLLTRLSALNEAAMIDVLCADKTGTLTSNELSVTAVRPLEGGWDAGDLLAIAALASSSDGGDPIDAAICTAARRTSTQRALPVVGSFTPFDPGTKRSEARATDSSGEDLLICKGSPTTFSLDDAARKEFERLSQSGCRTLAVAETQRGQERILGLIGISDTPRPDSAALLAELRALGVHTVMVTGDTPETARAVSAAIGLEGGICPSGNIPEKAVPEDFAVYASVFPEDKYRLVCAFQKAGYAVGMCGDGANDAPALRQAQMGIAVANATDVAKASAGMVLTTPGLRGIVAAIKEGRLIFQREVTYTMTILVNKVVTLVVLGAGLLMTGHAVLTPLLQAISMFATDFVSMTRTVDRATPSPRPNAWHARNLTITALPLALFKLLYCISVLAAGFFYLHLKTGQLQTLTFVMLVYAGQGVMYVLRERGHMFRSMPAPLLLTFSSLDVLFVSSLAVFGVFMAAVPLPVIATLFGTTLAFILMLDRVKLLVLRRAPID